MKHAMEDMEEPAGGDDESKEPMTEEGQPEGGEGEVTIPSSVLGGRQYSEGDTITLRVVSSDEEGIHAEIAGTKEGEGDQAPDAGGEIDSMASEPGGY